METDRAKLRLVRTGTLAGSIQPGPVVDDVSAPFARPALDRLNAVRLLALDAHGRALEWISWQEATCLYVRDAVAWTLGDPGFHGMVASGRGSTAWPNYGVLSGNWGVAQMRATSVSCAID